MLHTIDVFWLVHQVALRVLVSVLVTLMRLVDALDAVVWRCGLRPYALTRDTILAKLNHEELQEINSPDVAQPFQKFVQV